MLLQVHDELIFEVPEGEHLVPIGVAEVESTLKVTVAGPVTVVELSEAASPANTLSRVAPSAWSWNQSNEAGISGSWLV